MAETAKATPAKAFFIRMLTRDIALDDCVLDLIDNSIDGAKRQLASNLQNGEDPYGGFAIELEFGEEGFRIRDNCGGISLDDARDYAFHFGRRKDAAREPDESIGIYGIGMKRALFKIGRQIKVQSSTARSSFKVEIDVDIWEEADEWEFSLEPGDPWERPGTVIEVARLNRGVGAEFSDTAFVNGLIASISRDYSVFLQKGLEITAGRARIPPMEFSLRYGGEFEPAKIQFTTSGVEVEISAGMAALPPDPDEDLAEVEIKGVDRYGWFVLCNDRVVLAGDKTDRTVWGNDGFTRWHPQYYGFLGIASFRSDNPAELPWTTTKRDVDETNAVYRDAVVRMKELTKPYIEYTNARKADADAAKQFENDTAPRRIADIAVRPEMKLPSIARPTVRMGNVAYRKPKEVLRKAAAALGNVAMAYKDIGTRTFDYFYEREVDD